MIKVIKLRIQFEMHRQGEAGVGSCDGIIGFLNSIAVDVVEMLCHRLLNSGILLEGAFL